MLAEVATYVSEGANRRIGEDMKVSEATSGTAAAEVEVEKLPFSEFLKSTPPGVTRAVSGVRHHLGGGWFIALPRIQLFCEQSVCDGSRFFRSVLQPNASALLAAGKVTSLYLTYTCANCAQSLKTYSLRISAEPGETDGTAFKFGESPAFGPHTPSRLVSLIGPDRDAFLKGRRSESQGLGIGAFAYYRRVVENQKDRLLDEIIRVAEKTGAKPPLLESLRAARRETQFSKAIDLTRDAIPESLLVAGHNPLTLLHSALSEGIHARTDVACLELATNIRIVLQGLAERLAAALRDDAELTAAVSSLLHRNRDNGFDGASDE